MSAVYNCDHSKCTVKVTAVLLLFVFLAFATLPGPVVAHSPSGIILGYDSERETLTVSLSHDVADPNTHYVYRVEIRKNGAVYHEQEYTLQPTDSTFNYDYDLAVEAGDVIEVTAYCNVGGSITGRIEISGSSGTDQTAVTSSVILPYHAGIMILGFIFILTGALVARFIKRKTWWFKVHKIVQIFGSILSLVGVSLGFYMVSVTTGQHFMVPHAYVASATIILILANLALGLQLKKGGGVRVAHRWVGRAVLILLLVNVAIGLSLVGIL